MKYIESLFLRNYVSEDSGVVPIKSIAEARLIIWTSRVIHFVGFIIAACGIYFGFSYLIPEDKMWLYILIALAIYVSAELVRWLHDTFMSRGIQKDAVDMMKEWNELLDRLNIVGLNKSYLRCVECETGLVSIIQQIKPSTEMDTTRISRDDFFKSKKIVAEMLGIYLHEISLHE